MEKAAVLQSAPILREKVAEGIFLDRRRRDWELTKLSGSETK
jgi:hypothetical protein